MCPCVRTTLAGSILNILTTKKKSINVDPNDASIQNSSQSEFDKSSPAPSLFFKETIDIQYFIRNHLKGLRSKPHFHLNVLLQ